MLYTLQSSQSYRKSNWAFHTGQFKFKKNYCIFPLICNLSKKGFVNYAPKKNDDKDDKATMLIIFCCRFVHNFWFKNKNKKQLQQPKSWTQDFEIQKPYGYMTVDRVHLLHTDRGFKLIEQCILWKPGTGRRNQTSQAVIRIKFINPTPGFPKMTVYKVNFQPFFVVVDLL